MTNLLIVDDEVKIRDVISEYGQAYGYRVYQASDGLEALEYIDQGKIDLVILDIMMPELDGFSTLKQIKNIENLPIIMLTARFEEHDKLLSFELGVDDYVTKPFSPKELFARIEAVLKRYQNKQTTLKYQFENLIIDVSGREVYIGSKKIKLTPKEFELLVYLVSNQRIAISREKLLEEVWGYDYYGDDRTVDTHIKMLRQSLLEYRKYIITVRGMGYKFEV